ncbi:MAG TPA: hypothetical protein VMX77_01550 [Candidatus Bathyarchaeia archaeon]|nr:hypothetical protein [Candidatus Bathyarchaeia archaeon]
MTEKEKPSSLNKKRALGQILYHQATACVSKTGNNPQAEISGFLNCNRKALQGILLGLGLSDEAGLPAFSCLRFEISPKHNWLTRRERINLLLEITLGNGGNKRLVLTTTPDGNCRHKITQEDWIIGPYGVLEGKKELLDQKGKQRQEKEGSLGPF